MDYRDFQDESLRDFRKFLWLVFNHMDKTPTDTQYDIARELQRGHRRLMIQAFRGAGKSWLLGAYIAYRLYWNPEINVLVVSATQSKALEQSTYILRFLAEIPELQWLHPSQRVKRHGDVDFELRNSKEKFDVAPAPISQAPSVKAVGVFGQVTGSRADLIVADDIETADNSLTVDMRAKLSEIVKEFDNIAKPEYSEIIFLGTPQCEDTMYASLPDRGYTIRIWPAQYPLREHMTFYGDRLSASLQKKMQEDPSLQLPVTLIDEPDGGQAVDRRFPLEVLLEKRVGNMKGGYRLQFMLNSSASDADKHPLRLSDLIVADVPNDLGPPLPIWTSSPEFQDKTLPNQGLRGDRIQRAYKMQGDFIPYEDSLMFIDPSGRGTDETAYAVVKRLNGFLFLLAAGGFRSGYSPQTLSALANLAKQYQVKRVVTEDDFGDGMFRTLLQPVLLGIYKCGLEGVKVPRTAHKTKRIIETLEPVVSAHRLVVHPSVFVSDAADIPGLSPEKQHQYRLWWQYTRCTRDKDCIPHDDRLDAVAGAVAQFQYGLSIDATKNETKVRQQDHDRKLREWAKEFGWDERRSTFGSLFTGPVEVKPPKAIKERRQGLNKTLFVDL